MLIKTCSKVLIEAVPIDILVFFLILRGKHALFAMNYDAICRVDADACIRLKKFPFVPTLLKVFFLFLIKSGFGILFQFLLHILRWAILAMTNWKQFLEVDMGSSSRNHMLEKRVPEQNEWQQWILGRNQEHPFTWLLAFSYPSKPIIQPKLRCPKIYSPGPL